MSEKEKKSKSRISKRLIIFLTLLLVVFLILFFSTQIGTSSLRRFSYWLFDGVSGDGTEATIQFNESSSNLFTFLDGNLSVVSPNLLSVYELSGTTLLSAPVLLRSPAFSASTSSLLAYDLGGLNYYIADDDEILFSGTAESKILNANINANGDFAITTDSPDCKSLVSAYNADFETIYKFHSSEKYVFDAALSPDAKTVAIISYGTSEGLFQTELNLCRTNETAFFATIPLGESMPLKLSFLSEKSFVVICNDRLLLYDKDGTCISEIKYEQYSIKDFSFAYDDHVSILLTDRLSSQKSRLTILDKNGTSKTLDIDNDTYSLSASDKYTALLHEDKCVVYNNDLSKHCEVKTSQDISKCLVNTDGSVLLLSDNSATFFVK